MSDQAATAPLVSIVAVNYNGAEVLEAWLASVRASDYPRLEVLVVDNASTDDSVASLAAHADVAVITSPDNVGFGRACNLGAARARGELLLFMNPDVELFADTISVLAASLWGTDGAAVVCATLLEPDVEHQREQRVEDVASMAAATLLTTRAHFDAVGGFDPWIFLYSEDADLCFRTWLSGKRVLKDWNALAAHAQGGTGGGVRWSAEQIKNGLYVHLKTRSWPAVARYALLMAAKTVVRGTRLRDPAVLTAWWVNLRQLRGTLAKRRVVRGGASRADRELLERLGAEHAYWARRSWRRGVLRAVGG